MATYEGDIAIAGLTQGVALGYEETPRRSGAEAPSVSVECPCGPCRSDIPSEEGIPEEWIPDQVEDDRRKDPRSSRR